MGYDANPSEEVLRFIPDASFLFPSSAISNITFQKEDSISPLVMNTSFFSLYGRHGALPWHYTTRIHLQERLKNKSFRGFIDIFNHRLLSLFYRAGVKYRIPQQFSNEKHGRIKEFFPAFLGLSTNHIKNKLDNIGIPDITLLRYAGLFTQPHSAISLKIILSGFFKEPVNIEQFKGEWISIEESDRNKIGRNGSNNSLGQTFSIGKRIWSIQHKFRITVGPVDFKGYLSFIQDKRKFNVLKEITRLFCSPSLSFDIKIIIKDKNIPGMTLGQKNTEVGKSIWLISRQNRNREIFRIFHTE